MSNDYHVKYLYINVWWFFSRYVFKWLLVDLLLIYSTRWEKLIVLDWDGVCGIRYDYKLAYNFLLLNVLILNQGEIN